MNLIHILSVIFLFWIVIGTPISSFSSEKNALDYHSNPEAIVHEVSSRGAGVVVSELYSDLNIWYEVLRKIGSGNELWLKVAVSLLPGSDAGIGEMLDLVHRFINSLTY